MAIKIEMLRCFSTVAETGTLAEAAERLGRTQSAVSMTLKQLEEHLGQRLFETDRKNRLTPLGEQVFALARMELRQFDETVQAMETSARSPAGLIRVASIPSAAGLVLSDAIAAFAESHAEIEIELRDTDTQAVIDSLLRGTVDIGIASGSRALNGIRRYSLFSDRFGLIGAADHPLLTQEAAPDIDQIMQAGFVQNELCNMIEAEAFRQAITGAQVTARNTLSLIAMVRTGVWVTVLPQSVVHILPGELRFRPIPGLDQEREVVLYLRERSTYFDLAEAFVDVVREKFATSASSMVEYGSR